MGVVSLHAQFAYIFGSSTRSSRGARGARPGLRRRRVLHPGHQPGPARPPRCYRARAGVHLRGRVLRDERGRAPTSASPRSVAAFSPPVLFALTSDRLVAVVRRAALGGLADDESQRSAWRLFGTGVAVRRAVRLAPRSTAKGARQALLNATPLPELTSSAPAQLPAASPAALATTSRATRQRGINQGDRRVKGQPRTDQG